MGQRKKKKGKPYKASDKQTYQVTEMVSVNVNRVGEMTGSHDATPRKGASLGEIAVVGHKRGKSAKAARQENRATKKASKARKKEHRQARKRKKKKK